MRILVAFKVTPDYEALRDADWARVAAGESGATRYVRRMLNCFDESALELALRLRDEAAQPKRPGPDQGPPRLEALTIGGRETEPFLKTLLALGYARATRVEPATDLDFAPAATASLIAAYARQSRADLALLGCRSGPGDAGIVPFLAAEMLRWPCLTELTELKLAPKGGVRVTCSVDDGVLQATLRPPGMLAVGNAVVSRLRVPTLTDRLAARDDAVTVLTAAQLGVDVLAAGAAGGAALVDLELIDRRRAGMVVAGATPGERVRELAAGPLGPLLETS